MFVQVIMQISCSLQTSDSFRHLGYSAEKINLYGTCNEHHQQMIIRNIIGFSFRHLHLSANGDVRLIEFPSRETPFSSPRLDFASLLLSAIPHKIPSRSLSDGVVV
jgi:hypothetical protein